MKRFTFLSLLIIIGGLSILYSSLKLSQPTAGCGVTDFQPFCGTQNLTENASKGKQIFNANCAACHKLDKIMTGPPLRSIAQKYDTITIQKYLREDKTVIKSKDYNSNCVNFPQLNLEDISNIIEYTN